jgi:hypothetical protein
METLPIPHPGQLLLLAAPRPFLRQAIPLLIARLALSDNISVLDFGNSFNFHVISRSLRRYTVDLNAHLERIHVARAFTCYQVLSLLAQTPSGITPTICLEFLSTFYDENLTRVERWRLFEQSLVHFQRLSRTAPVAVSAAVLPGNPPDEWFEALEVRSTQVWRLENHPSVIQSSLF